MTGLLLVRHCRAAGQEPGAELTTAGRREAEGLAGLLAASGVDHLVTSPFRRALASIEPFARSRGLVPETEPRLAERTLSARPLPHWRAVVRDSFADPDLRAPGGESAREVTARGWAALHELAARGFRLPAAVSHGNLIALVLHAIDADFGDAGWAALSNPDVFLLERDAAGAWRFERRWREPPPVRALRGRPA